MNRLATHSKARVKKEGEKTRFPLAFLSQDRSVIEKRMGAKEVFSNRFEQLSCRGPTLARRVSLFVSRGKQALLALRDMPVAWRDGAHFVFCFAELELR